MAKTGYRLRERRVLIMVYEHHKIDKELGLVFDIENIIAVLIKCDKLAQLKSGRGSAPAGQWASVFEAVLRLLLYRRPKRSLTLREELVHYGRAHPNTPEETHACLYKAIGRRTTLRHHEYRRRHPRPQHRRWS